MAYDSATGNVVLFGGNNMSGGNGAFADTWIWNGLTRSWTQQHPGSSPSARGSIQLIYDQTTQKVVLFGGTTANLATLNDTWTWNGTTWTQQFPASAPSARNGAALAYDPGLAAVLLFGGAVGICCSNNVNDTWTWNGTNWTQIFPSSTLPSSRNTPGMVYDSSSKVVLLFGGQASNVVLGDTWRLTLAP